MRHNINTNLTLIYIWTYHRTKSYKLNSSLGVTEEELARIRHQNRLSKGPS